MDIDRLFERYATTFNHHARSRGLYIYPVGPSAQFSLKDLLRGSAPIQMSPEEAERFRAEFFRMLLQERIPLTERDFRLACKKRRFVESGVMAKKRAQSVNKNRVYDAALEILQSIKSAKLPSDRWLASRISERTGIKLGTVRAILIALNKKHD